jgi:hypothetical protein
MTADYPHLLRYGGRPFRLEMEKPPGKGGFGVLLSIFRVAN